MNRMRGDQPADGVIILSLVSSETREASHPEV
jgi:hypothetical protein